LKPLADPPLVDVRGLTVRYGDTTVLQDVALTLHPGERVAVVGASGSGKTTLGRTLLCLTPGARVSAQVLTVCGLDLLRAKPSELRSLRGGGVGFVFQDALATLDPLQRIGSALREAMAAHLTQTRAQAEARLLHLLAEVELPEPERMLAAYPHEISGGQRQRVGLALALCAEPSLIVADEPTSALDPPLARGLAALLRRLCSPGPPDTATAPPSKARPALLLISHDMQLVRATCDRALVLAAGRLVETGTLGRLLADPQHEVTRALLQAAGLAEVA